MPKAWYGVPSARPALEAQRCFSAWRDNIHAADLAELIVRIIDAPGTPGQVFNVGGGLANSCSILEAFKLVEDITGKAMDWIYDPEARRGDQVCYYTDLRKVMAAYPGWQVHWHLPLILQELAADWQSRELS